MIVTQPYQSERHIAQQEALASWLRRHPGDHPRVRYVDLGRGVVDLRDPALSYDGAHLTPAGNERIAEALIEPLLALLGGRQR